MVTDHDPGDEDRSSDGLCCVRCGVAFDAPETDCPNPAPGVPLIDCGRGGHMFLRYNRNHPMLRLLPRDRWKP